MTANRIARACGWLLVSAAAFLTLAPRSFRPQTGVEHHLEHVLAFALLGLAFGLGYPGRRLLLALLGVAMAALLEVLQAWAPGRHANLSDFMMNAIGVGAGLAVAALIDQMRRRRPGAQATTPPG
jgi:VanZ family protein